MSEPIQCNEASTHGSLVNRRGYKFWNLREVAGVAYREMHPNEIGIHLFALVRELAYRCSLQKKIYYYREISYVRE